MKTEHVCVAEWEAGEVKLQEEELVKAGGFLCSVYLGLMIQSMNVNKIGEKQVWAGVDGGKCQE